jgi:predicted lysophospholipase L1 biosynthesis ABC-type transport system permease subunit
MADALFPQEEALGKLLQLGRTQRLIVGIAANVRSQTLEQPAAEEMYLPEAQVAARALTFVLRSQLPPGEVISAARRVVQDTDRNLPLIRAGTLSDIVDQQVARPRFYMLLLTLFAVLAVSLAAIGTYGVVAYAVAQRTREIGVRLALGARPLQVVAIVLWQGCRPAAIGIAGGLAASLWVTRSLRGLLFEVPANDGVTFTVVTATLIALVLAACVVPARRAVRVSPARALRND